MANDAGDQPNAGQSEAPAIPQKGGWLSSLARIWRVSRGASGWLTAYPTLASAAMLLLVMMFAVPQDVLIQEVTMPSRLEAVRACIASASALTGFSH